MTDRTRLAHFMLEKTTKMQDMNVVYWLDSSSLPSAVEPRLSATEQRRLGKISHPRRRRQFLAGRWLVQIALRDRFQSPLAYATSDTGALDCELAGYAIGLSHSRSAIAVCIGAGERLGLDIEPIRSRDCLTLAKACFHSAESKQLSALPPDKALERFYDLWCLKEATAKHRRTSIFSGVLSQKTSSAHSPGSLPAYHSGRHQQHALALCCENTHPVCIKEVGQHAQALECQRNS
ncbi:MAG: 4'-phosphopantetheinyl transferase family protein [Pseudomonadales bacterium]